MKRNDRTRTTRKRITHNLPKQRARRPRASYEERQQEKYRAWQHV